ncbi:hypothetical protein CMV_012251 [Castanea mollissima]|uniref:ABC transporter domain-containing protein n=1 Tax=Castanea mollissima TaxID=60419 RepID=A0A8J4R3W0_9ROSI|nr:hypothetical protein CMV_012251 [Castanea mollissima]
MHSSTLDHLRLEERKSLVERLVKVPEEDNEKFLYKIKDRFERVGITIPTIEVHFEHLNVEAEVHVGSRALPTVLNFPVNIVEGFLNNLHILPHAKKHLSILQDVSGVIKPSRMTLLLGPPSSGKTTLLLALAGQLDPDLKFSGEVSYNGHEMNEFVPQRTAAYVSQYDLHLGEMTVRETLAFSARCQGVGSRYEMLAELERREKEANIKPDPDVDIYMKAVATEGQDVNVVTDYFLKVLGLEVCADTLVGNQMLRGISGGQRKRVTTGEMLVGPSKVLLMDEISTGLDSSTAFQIVNSIKQYVHILDGTAVISLLQPAPETYNLFDDIILISDGQIVYQGSREQVLEFFETMGFKCPKRKGVADFLQEVTSYKDQEQYWVQKDKPYNFVTVKEFAEAFQSFHVGWKLRDELAARFDKAKSHPASLTTKKYGVKKEELLKACLSREFLLMKRNSFVYIFKFIQLTILAIIAMTIFLRIKMPRNSVEDGGIYTGALFYGLVVILFNGIAEMPMTVAKLPVFYKQRKLLFYPPWVYSLPPWIIKIPITFVEVAVWVFITYYVIGFDPSPVRFFRQFLLLILLNQMASSLFRFIATTGRGSLILASTFGSFVLVTLFALGGFVLARENIKKWWIWGYWMSPMMYAQNAIVVNEFLGKSWRHVLPNSTEPLGIEVLKSRGFFPQAYCFGKATILKYSVDMPQEMKNQGVTEDKLVLLNAWLRLSPEVDSQKRKMFVEEVMELVELKPLRQALVGLPSQNGLSTEQRKRLTIAVELVANPSIIFMDEPTSGLDARAAAIVMRTVRNTVDTGRTVVCTIHQPSIDIFEAFDELFLMKNGGKEIYVGPLGRQSCHLIQYFEGIDGVSKIKDGYNPATWMLEVTSSANETALGIDFANVYRNSELYRRNKELIEQLSTPVPGSKDLYFPTQYSQSYFTQFMACLWKQHWSYWRNPLYTFVRFFFTTLIALMFGTMFWNLGSKTTKQQDLFNAMGSMYAAVLFVGVKNSNSVQPVVSVERTVFYRERAAGMYSALSYAFAQVLIEFPYVFVQALVYGVIVYVLIGFEWTAAKFFWYIFFMYTSLLYFTFYGMMAVAVTPNQDTSSTISSAFLAIWNIFSGFIIPHTRIPIWWRWYSWACPFFWTLYGLVASQFGDKKDMLDIGETVEDFVRDYFGFNHDFLGVVAIVNVAFVIVFAFTFTMSIKVFNFQRR